MRFEDFIGQARLISDLRKAIAGNRVGHAYLLIGPAGIGRETLARLFAQALLCEDRADPPCDRCGSCAMIRAGTHPDLEMVHPDGASIRIEQIRALRARVALKPLLGRYRIYLLAEMERLSEAAANSFLLTLEDPPPGVIFIGWALDGQPILPTILSRCQIARLHPLPPAVLAEKLRARGAGAEEAAAAAAQSDGLPGSALHMLEVGGGHPEDREGLPVIYSGDLLRMLTLAEEWSQKDRETVGRHLAGLSRSLQNAIIRRASGQPLEEPRLAELASEALWRMYQRAAQAEQFLQANAHIRLVLDVLFLSIYQEFAPGHVL